MRNKAYALKEDYIENSKGEKQKFLELFSSAETLLDEDYMGYKVDENSLATASWIKKDADIRRQNAQTLLMHLKDSKIVKPIYKALNKEDVPLFVPVCIKNGLRDKLRTYLIENAVYCPVHWPSHNGCENQLYKEELSLICDQRYNSDDMIRQIELIKAFEERFG